MDYTPENMIEIDGNKIGSSCPCYIVAEIGINHNGELNLAKKLIDAAVNSGADAVKFQKRDIESLYTQQVLENPNLENQGTEILIDVLREVEFNEQEYVELINYCKDKKITFLSTAWDIPSVDFLEKIRVPAYKVASADMTNFPLIKYISKTKKPMIISSGMSMMDEIEKTVNFVKNLNVPFVLLHSNSTYPSPVDLLNLDLIPTLRKNFQIPVGYSGHEQTIIPSVTAANLGAVIIERHITLDKTMKGLDQSASLEPDDFKTLVNFIRESELSKGKSLKKMTRGEILQREVLGKGIICNQDIKKGETFTEENLTIKSPFRGLSPQYYYDFLGKKSLRDIKKGEYLQSDDLQ